MTQQSHAWLCIWKKKKPTNLDGLRQVLDAFLSLRVSTAHHPFPSSLVYSLPVTPPQSNLPVYYEGTCEWHSQCDMKRQSFPTTR